MRALQETLLDRDYEVPKESMQLDYVEKAMSAASWDKNFTGKIDLDKDTFVISWDDTYTHEVLFDELYPRLAEAGVNKIRFVNSVQMHTNTNCVYSNLQLEGLRKIEFCAYAAGPNIRPNDTIKFKNFRIITPKLISFTGFNAELLNRTIIKSLVFEIYYGRPKISGGSVIDSDKVVLCQQGQPVLRKLKKWGLLQSFEVHNEVKPIAELAKQELENIDPYKEIFGGRFCPYRSTESFKVIISETDWDAYWHGFVFARHPSIWNDPDRRAKYKKYEMANNWDVYVSTAVTPYSYII